MPDGGPTGGEQGAAAGACADGEAASGQETRLGQGPELPFSAAPFSATECVHVWPHLLIRAPTSSGAGPEVVAHRRWAGARASPRSKRLLVALTSQSGSCLGYRCELTCSNSVIWERFRGTVHNKCSGFGIIFELKVLSPSMPMTADSFLL